MSQEHLITPPHELVQQWLKEWAKVKELTGNEDVPFYNYLAAQAASWGADQELGASVAWLISNQNPRWALALQEARRPKPPSLKDQALALIRHDPENQPFLSKEGIAIIRRALESLPEEQ